MAARKEDSKIDGNRERKRGSKQGLTEEFNPGGLRCSCPRVVLFWKSLWRLSTANCRRPLARCLQCSLRDAGACFEINAKKFTLCYC